MERAPSPHPPPAERPRRPLSIRTKLVGLAVGLVLVPGLTYGWVADRSARSSLRRAVGNQLVREVRHTGERLAELLAAEERALTSFARQDLMRDVRVGDLDKRIAVALDTLVEGSDVRLAYLVVDPGGVVVSSGEPGLIGRRLGWWPPAPDVPPIPTAPVTILGPDHFPEVRGPALALATPIPDPDGGEVHLGTLVALVDWLGVLAIPAEVRHDLADLGLTTSVALLGPGERVLGRVGPLPPDLTTRGAQQRPFPGPNREDEPAFSVRASPSYLLAEGVLGPALPGTRLLLAAPLADALAPVRTLRRRMLGTLAAGLVVAVALATAAARRLVRPLEELTGALGRVSRDGAEGVQVTVRDADEVGVLAEAFNRMATDLDRAQRELVEAAQFAFVGELAAGVAHEVRTSLGVLRSSAQMLARVVSAGGRGDGAAGSGQQPDAATTELVTLVREEVDRLARVVDDLLDLSRPRVTHIEPTPIDGPLRRACELAEAQAHERGIRLELRSAPAGSDAPIAACDPELLHRAILNLVVNALQAVPPGGRVTVTAGRDASGDVRIDVDDDGPGVPAHVGERVFLPFVSERPGGVGLGLTLVKRIVHEHRGRIALEPSPLGGARFRIVLPAAPAADGEAG